MYPDPSGARSSHALPWLASFDVGDARIDDEHRALIDSANDLCRLAAGQGDEQAREAAAHALITLVAAHFDSEEALFPTIGYTDRHDHMREHTAIRMALPELLLGASAMAPTDAAAAARLMLVEHLLRHDLGFKTWVQERHGQ